MDKLKSPMFAEERQMQILTVLHRDKKILVHDLCELLSVSPVTIRTDLTDLEGKGLLSRTHGGAILCGKMTFEENAEQKEVKNMPLKLRIAEEAVKFVEDGDSIAIDTGTTTSAFTSCLTEKHGLTVVTSDLKVALFLEENTDATVIIVGGTVRRGYHCTVGTVAEQTVGRFNVDKCFLGTNGLTARRGLSTPNAGQAAVKQLMIDRSNQLFVLCDREKIGRDSLATVAPASAIHVLITNEGADQEELAAIEQCNVDIHCV